MLFRTQFGVFGLSLLVFCNVHCKSRKGEGVRDGNGNEEYTTEYRSYQNSVYCSASTPIQYPADAEELHALIQLAIATSNTVKVLGQRHSMTDTICTEGIPISTQNINYTMFSPDLELVTVGSGLELMDLLYILHESGRTLIHLPAYGGITIGGAVAVGVHGSSLRHPTTISDQVVEMTIIDGSGEYRVINKNTDPDDMRALKVHLGLLGAVINVTLRTVPSYKVTVHNYEDSEDILFDGTALKEAWEHDWYQLWWFPSSQSVVVSKGTYTWNLETPGDAETHMIPNVTSTEILSGREGFERAQSTKNKRALYALEDFTRYSLYTDVKGKPPIFSETGPDGQMKFVNPATGFGHRIQTSRCTDKCAWENGDSASIFPEESAMAFDMHELPNVASMMRGVFQQIPAAFVLIGVFIRFSKASDALMAINGRNSVHMEWTTPMRNDPYKTARDAVGAYQAIVQGMVHNHGGKPHWGKNGQYYFTRDILRKRGSNLYRFQDAMRNFDPNGLFLNKFGRRILLQSDELSVDPQVTRCALQDYCVCSKNADCAPFQVCTKLNGFPICKEVLPVGLFPKHPLENYNPKNITSILDQINGADMGGQLSDTWLNEHSSPLNSVW